MRRMGTTRPMRCFSNRTVERQLLQMSSGDPVCFFVNLQIRHTSNRLSCGNRLTILTNLSKQGVASLQRTAFIISKISPRFINAPNVLKHNLDQQNRMHSSNAKFKIVTYLARLKSYNTNDIETKVKV